MDDLVQAMATTELWIELAFVIVFGGGCFACYRAATKAERAGNKRRATILGIAPFVDEEDALLFADDWLYFGVLRPRRLRVHKHVPPGEPYVKLPPEKGGSLDEAGLAYYLDDEEPA